MSKPQDMKTARIYKRDWKRIAARVLDGRNATTHDTPRSQADVVRAALDALEEKEGVK